MNSLRETIRKILLENQQHYEKLVSLMIDDTIENVRQGIELADTLGHIQVLDSDVQRYSGLSSTWHIWKFKAGQELYEMLCEAWENFDGNTTYLDCKPDYSQKRPDADGMYKFEIHYREIDSSPYKSDPNSPTRKWYEDGGFDRMMDRYRNK